MRKLMFAIDVIALICFVYAGLSTDSYYMIIAFTYCTLAEIVNVLDLTESV